jgi:hypothetical protein
MAFGDPCRECGFDWTTSFNEAVGIIRAAPDAFDGLLAGATGLERTPRPRLECDGLRLPCDRQPQDLVGTTHGIITGQSDAGDGLRRQPARRGT